LFHICIRRQHHHFTNYQHRRHGFCETLGLPCLPVS